VRKLEASTRPRNASLKRLAVVYADPLRMKIVTELYLREMSPTQFHEEFGGGSVSRVDRHFKKLIEHDWLEFIRKESGGRRRGGIEHFYRATELAIFDLERWSELPTSIRASFSLMTFEQMTERVVAAISAGTFDARPDRHLSWTSILLDQLGWRRLITAIDGLFEAVVEGQSRAKLRVMEVGETPTMATVGLAAFEAAIPIERNSDGEGRSGLLSSGLGSTGTASDARLLFPMHLAKVFADPLALQIVAEANLREISPSQFRDEFGGGTASDLSRRFQRLERAGWLEMTRAESGGRRRGATEHFYQAVGPAILDNKGWSEVSSSIRSTVTWKTFEQLREKVISAIEAGTLDAHPDRHLTWSLLRLDQAGWEQVVAAVDALFTSLFEEQEKAKLRMAASGEKPITMTVALTAFESPEGGPKAH
jgi:DNA-binding PadR family transcriptional regulator